MNINKIINRFAFCDWKHNFEYYTWENFAMKAVKLALVEQVTKCQFNCLHRKILLCVLFEIIFKITENESIDYFINNSKEKYHSECFRILY